MILAKFNKKKMRKKNQANIRYPALNKLGYYFVQKENVFLRPTPNQNTGFVPYLSSTYVLLSLKPSTSLPQVILNLPYVFIVQLFAIHVRSQIISK